jgi:hypothetical protein
MTDVALRTLQPTEPIVILHVSCPSGVLLAVPFLVDTGSNISLITDNTGGAIGIDFAAQIKAGNKATADTVGGTKITYVPADLHIGFESEQGGRCFVTVQGGVAPTSRNVLGRDFLMHFRVTWDGDRIVISPREEERNR